MSDADIIRALTRAKALFQLRAVAAVMGIVGPDTPDWTYDSKEDGSGIDDGPPVPPDRRKSGMKPAEEMTAIRTAAWETRRQKYGRYGHR